MELVYITIGIVVGVVGILILDIDSLSNFFAKKEKKFDAKDERNEKK